MTLLTFDRVECLPLVHGRLAFAIEARRRLLEHRFDCVAVELPPSLRSATESALDRLPTASVILYSETPAFLYDRQMPCYYVPIQPADGIVEALRIARGERIPCDFIDAEIEDFQGRPTVLPDPHILHTLGMDRYFELCRPIIQAQSVRSKKDEIRELHMAARLAELLVQYSGRILFLCGMAHWIPVRAALEARRGVRYPGEGVPGEQVRVLTPEARSIPFIMGEPPYTVTQYEQHRSGLELDDFDAVKAVKKLLYEARTAHGKRFPGSLELPGPQSLRSVLDFARKMTVRKNQLVPDSYTLTVSANGVIGNDYALSVLELAHFYPWNGRVFAEDELEESAASDFPEEPLRPGSGNAISMNSERGVFDDREVTLRNRVPGTAFQYGHLQLEQRPDTRRRREWRTKWDESVQCSWPPEDLVIENFRDYVGKRALSLARVGMTKTEPFTTAFLDGIDIRETMRDVIEERIHVREEPRVPGAIGALVIIFEEDDFGIRYPWRTTWMAEHDQESSLAFYATDYKDNVIGPGVARAHYGGCMLIFPPRIIPDVWDDLRFERARTPSERLLIAAIYWSQDYFIAHVGARRASDETRAEARRRGKHLLHLPLSTFNTTTLERLRRVHVLNGHHVRTWAHGFIR